MRKTSVIQCLVIITICFAQTPLHAGLKQDYEDFLHYAKIARFDMAKGYAQKVIDECSDPVKLLEIAQQNPRGYHFLQRAAENPHAPELAQLASGIYEIIEEGKFIRRTDPKVIVQEIKRLSTTERGFRDAVQRLKNAGEYAIPYMIDTLADTYRKDEWPNVIRALPLIGKDAIRPLAAALQTNNMFVKQQIVESLGQIRYPQALAYLQYVVENSESPELRNTARHSIRQIDPAGLIVPAAQLFNQLAEKYYYHTESLAPALNAEFANIWFWDEQTKRLIKHEVDKDYFYELMAMRCCEWSLKADPEFGRSISLWLAAYFKAESTGIAMPDYFGSAHPNASVYATTAGPEYLHQVLDRALEDENPYIALGAVEALAITAGEKSLLYYIDAEQPLVRALTFNNKPVKFSAAIAIAAAGPTEDFPGSEMVIQNLIDAIASKFEPNQPDEQFWGPEIADSYARRSAEVMLKLALTNNRVIKLLDAKNALIEATNDPRAQIQKLAGQILAHIDSPDAQRAIAQMGLKDENSIDVRINAFQALAVSAKKNANMLDDQSIDHIYDLVNSPRIPQQLNSAAAAAYGALNLPSRKVKDLILDQAKS